MKRRAYWMRLQDVPTSPICPCAHRMETTILRHDGGRADVYAQRGKINGILTLTLSEAERVQLRADISLQTRDGVMHTCNGRYATCALCVLFALLVKHAPTEPVPPAPVTPVDPLLHAYDNE